jgi:aryl-alcohol dehydrogenase-like predicted oxidoreductase
MLNLQKTGDYGFWDADTVRRILLAYDLCEETGISLTDITLRYILADPDISAVIPGAQQVSHIQANINAALAGPLPEELVKRIDAISQS